VSFDGETLLTPPLSDRVLDSITRRHLLALLPHAREAVVLLDELPGAREAFLASTTREVQPIARIDAIEIPQCPGPLSAAAADTFAAHIRDAIDR
jgi:branched-subunit amino acid aminotransferase/4-amino-4-deoxychorismate lyase